MTILFKKNLCLFLFTFIFLFIAGSIYLVVYEKSISTFFISEEEYNNIIENKKIDSNLNISKIYFNNQPLILDTENNNLYYSLNLADKNAYSPQIKYKSENKINIAFLQDNYYTDEKIRNNIPLKMLVYSDNTYNIQHIYATTLPLMSLKDDTVYFYDNRKAIINRIFKSKCEYEIRGTSSTYFRKKNFKLKLKQIAPATKNKKKFKHSFLNMPKTDIWHLYAGYNDPDKIRNVLSAKIWQDMCISNNNNMGFEYKYIELFIDNKYQGLYALGYPVNEKKFNLKQGECLFKIKDWVKIEYAKKNNNYNYFKKRVKLKFGNEQAWKILLNYFNKLSGEYPNKEVIIPNIIDIKNQIDFWIFTVFVQNEDCYYPVLKMKNTYIMYKNGKYYQIPWDFDLTFGQTFGHPEFIDEDMKIKRYKIDSGGKYIDMYKKEPYFIYYSKPDYNTIPFDQLNPISYLVSIKDKEIKEKIKTRYKYLRSNEWSDENIMTNINNYENDIFNSGAYLREKEKWELGAYVKDEKQKLSVFKEFVKNRCKFADDYFYSL